MDVPLSAKRLQIDKVQKQILIAVSATAFIVVFCLISSMTLWSQAGYQRHAINARRDAANRFKSNASAATQLVNSYQTVFANPNRPDNVIGGKNTTVANTNPPDGDNTRIVLDALPIKYDFPALITSMSNILNHDGLQSPSVAGSDQSATANNTASATPAAVPIQLTISGSGSQATVQKLIKDLERSIRPFDITSIQLSGNAKIMSVNLSLTTYYQPAKSLTIGEKEIQ